MVQIASPNGYYEVPIFELAKGLARALSYAPAKGSRQQDILCDLVQGMGFEGKDYKTVCAIPMGALDVPAMAALPRILQDVYDHPLSLEKPTLRFYSALVLEYVDGSQRVVLMDEQAVEDEQKKKECSTELSNRRLVSVLPFMLAASTEKSMDIPLNRMQRSLDRAKRMMFDHSRYRYGEHRLVDESYVGFARRHDSLDAADRLLATVADAYGMRLMVAEQPEGGVISIIPENAFQHMEESEKPTHSKDSGWSGGGR